MDTSDIISYAVWTGIQKSSDQKIKKGFRSLWEDTLKYFELRPRSDADTSEFKPWIGVGKDFYLLHAELHWSPGDVCGFLKTKKFLDPEDEVIALRIDKDSYIPHQGLCDKAAGKKLHAWQDQVNQFYLVGRTRGTGHGDR